MVQALDHEVEGLKFAVPSAIVEIDALHLIVYAILYNVGPGEFCRRFLQIRYQRVRAHQNAVVHISVLLNYS